VGSNTCPGQVLEIDILRRTETEGQAQCTANRTGSPYSIMPTFIPGLSDFFSTKTYQQIMESYNLIGTQLYPFIPGGETPSFHHVILHILQSFSKKSRLHYEYLSRHPKKTRMLIKQKEQKRTLNVSEEGWASMKDRTHVETFFFSANSHQGITPTIPTGQWMDSYFRYF